MLRLIKKGFFFLLAGRQPRWEMDGWDSKILIVSHLWVFVFMTVCVFSTQRWACCSIMTARCFSRWSWQYGVSFRFLRGSTSRVIEANLMGRHKKINKESGLQGSPPAPLSFRPNVFGCAISSALDIFLRFVFECLLVVLPETSTAKEMPHHRAEKKTTYLSFLPSSSSAPAIWLWGWSATRPHENIRGVTFKQQSWIALEMFSKYRDRSSLITFICWVFYVLLCITSMMRVCSGSISLLFFSQHVKGVNKASVLAGSCKTSRFLSFPLRSLLISSKRCWRSPIFGSHFCSLGRLIRVLRN